MNKKYRIIRFHPRVAEYIMLKHKKESPNPDRHRFLDNGYLRYETDGLNSLVYRENAVTSMEFYTNIKVEV